jgi:hypothetical protein
LKIDNMDSRFRGNDDGHMDSRFRGNDDGHMDSRFRGNDDALGADLVPSAILGAIQRGIRAREQIFRALDVRRRKA